jgi:hypothetical protein
MSFKVGDKVVLKETYGGFAKGTKGVVTEVKPIDSPMDPYLITFAVGNKIVCCYSKRLERVSIDTLSDQELADKFRELTVQRSEICNLLKERGYTFTAKRPDGKIVAFVSDAEFIIKREVNL